MFLIVSSGRLRSPEDEQNTVFETSRISEPNTCRKNVLSHGVTANPTLFLKSRMMPYIVYRLGKTITRPTRDFPSTSKSYSNGNKMESIVIDDPVLCGGLVSGLWSESAKSSRLDSSLSVFEL